MKSILENKYIISIDRGNSKTSYALHDLSNPHSKLISIDEAYLYHEEAFIIASNVADIDEYGITIDVDVRDFFKNNFFLEMPVHYAKTLGSDRLALAYLVWTYLNDTTQAKKSNLALAIDVGTFMTVDLISKDRGFLGGLIFPGPFTLMESYTRGAQLKNLPPDFYQSNLAEELPTNTDSAISTAGAFMMKATIESLIQKFIHIDEIYLTGGAYHLVKDLFPNEKTRENKLLLHRALYIIGKKILKTNSES